MATCKKCHAVHEEVWNCSDDLWAIISGHHDGSGIWCMKCFEKEARKKGVALYWECKAWQFPSSRF